MRKNYKISEHRFYHAWRRTMDCAAHGTSVAASAMWKGFLKPVLVLAVGIGLSAPFAHIASRVLEAIIW